MSVASTSSMITCEVREPAGHGLGGYALAVHRLLAGWGALALRAGIPVGHNQNISEQHAGGEGLRLLYAGQRSAPLNCFASVTHHRNPMLSRGQQAMALCCKTQRHTAAAQECGWSACGCWTSHPSYKPTTHAQLVQRPLQAHLAHAAVVCLGQAAQEVVVRGLQHRERAGQVVVLLQSVECMARWASTAHPPPTATSVLRQKGFTHHHHHHHHHHRPQA